MRINVIFESVIPTKPSGEADYDHCPTELPCSVCGKDLFGTEEEDFRIASVDLDTLRGRVVCVDCTVDASARGGIGRFWRDAMAGERLAALGRSGFEVTIKREPCDPERWVVSASADGETHTLIDVRLDTALSGLWKKLVLKMDDA